MLFISGQVPETVEGHVPVEFRDQCLLVWSNIERQLTGAGMSLSNLVKITVFLSGRQYRGENAAVRKEVLKDISPAITVVITGIYEEKWLLEIEAIAAE